MFKILRTILHIINAIVILVLIAIHFVIKESTYQTSLYYYTFPLPIIILIVLALTVFLNKKFRRYNLIIASVFLIIWLSRSFKFHLAGEIDENDLEIVFWNASHDREFEDVFKEVKTMPDVIVLVEYHGDYLEKTKEKYPEYHFFDNYNEEIGVFSKKAITIKKVMSSEYGSTVINFETQGINFYAVDVSGSMDVPRSWETGFANKAITKKRNTVVLGDFNVPFESKFLKPIKESFNHAFNEKGNGFRETWFWGFPFLSLDHIWVSRDLEVLKTQKINNSGSDHSMLITVINRTHVK